MEKKEYYTTKEIAISTNQTTRNIRYIINKLDVPKSMLFKDINGTYNIHHLLIPRFAPKYTGNEKGYALSFDILSTYDNKNIVEIIKHIINELPDLKIKYCIETKKNGIKHIHSMIEGVSKSIMKKMIRTFFHEETRIYVSGIYDKQGWLKYITKESPLLTNY